MKHPSLNLGVLLMFSLAIAPWSAMAGEAMTAPRSAVAPVTDKIIHVQTLIFVPPAKAFTYFAVNELLQSWLTAVADVEPTVLGAK